MTDLDSASADVEPSRSPLTPGVLAKPEWSERARRWLLLAVIVGGLTTVIGLLLFLGNSRLTSIGGVVSMLFGLYLLPLGIGTSVMALRMRRAAPDQAYVPSTIENPRKWFILIWSVGLVVSLVLKPRVAADIKPMYAVWMLVSSALVISGGVWCLHWLSSKIVAEWPTGRIDAPAPIPLRWPFDWTVAWSIMGGAFSGLLALLLEVGLIAVFGSTLSAPLSNLLLSSNADSALDAPIVILILFGAAVAAPLVEELCKALMVIVFRKSINRPIDGLMLGMASGLGFGLMEGLLYLIGGFSLWWIGAWLRLATILMHGTTTSIIGVAYARSRRSGQRRDLFQGYIRAVLLHGLWNGLVIGAALIAVGGQAIFGCGGLILWLALMSRQLPRISVANVETSVQDEYVAADLPMPPDWSPMDNGLAWKFAGSRPRYVERIPNQPPTTL